MSTPNPLVPEGSLQQSKGKSNVKIAVFTILAIHAVLLVGLLMQGCKEKPKTVADETTSVTNETTAAVPTLGAPSDVSTTTAPLTGSSVPAAVSSVPAAVPVSTSVSTATTAPVTTSAPAAVDPVTTASAKEYVIASGDTLGKVAKENHISLKTLLEANPNINPTKLQIGQKVQIPAATATATAKADAPAAADASAASEGLYVVKAGDVLERIAKSHGTSVKAIKTTNNLKTDRLKVGQKLKVPAAKTATASADAAPVASASTLTPTPLTTTATMASSAK